MSLSRTLSLFAAGLCLFAQTPPQPSPPSSGVTETLRLPVQVVAPPNIPRDRVVLQVGDVKFTYGQVEDILETYPENQRVYANGPGRGVFIDQVVRNILLSEEGKRRKLNETEAYRNQIAYMTAGILTILTDQQIKEKASSDESLLKAYYEAHKADYEQIHPYHILIRMKGSPLSLAPGQKDMTEGEALAKALEIREKILQGADFSALARTDSDDMGSSAKGGDLGFIKHGQSVPSFEEAAYALPLGELSHPVKSTYGYHIVKVTERKPTQTFDELRPEFEKAVAAEASRKFLQELKTKAKVVIDPEYAGSAQNAAGPAK